MPKEGDPFVAIAGVVSGIALVMLIFTLVFAPSQLWILMPIVGTMAILGIALGYFASKPRRFRR